jgi:diguanylate cyclase (GGDEF)-like protein
MNELIFFPAQNNHEQQLQLEIKRLLAEIEALQQENHDLQIALLTTAEHGDTVEEILEETNQKLQREVEQRKQAETKLQDLLEIVSQQRDDLEVLINILTEHGDVIDHQWSQKISEVNELVMIDPLTELVNRRGFDFHLQKQWEINQEQDNYLTLLFCDIDYFKQYNDLYGHLGGDDCLKKVAGILLEEFKPFNGIICRYGGEEFSVILPEISLETAWEIAAQSQQELAQLKIEHQGSLVSSYVTLSIGISSIIPNATLPPKEFIDYTDKLMYLAKNQGRNKIIAQPMN